MDYLLVVRGVGIELEKRYFVFFRDCSQSTASSELINGGSGERYGWASGGLSPSMMGTPRYAAVAAFMILVSLRVDG